jgi:tRNA dimethylallyltransferase
MKNILAIVGPTAVGKTSIAVGIAKESNGEIIGLDSRQIYTGMAIGTAQPTEEEMDGIRHHLMGFREPSEPVSAGEYAKLVKEKVEEIQSHGKSPIICGGAGLYYRALTKGIFEGSISDLPTRERLEKKYEENPEALLHRLRSIDPEYEEIVHINNKKRLVRALEIYETTGKIPSDHFKLQKNIAGKTLRLFTVFLMMDKEILNDKIEKRTEEMLDSGWIDEVKLLVHKQAESGKPFPSLDSIGYREIQAFLNDEMSIDEMKEEIIIKTRQYSRRQVQWFRNEKVGLTIDISQLDRDQITQNILNLLHQPNCDFS